VINGITSIPKLENPGGPIGKISERSLAIQPKYVMQFIQQMIESLNSVIRHSTKKRKIFSSDDSVKKVIYLATSNAAKKWTMPIQNWRLAMNWFTIQFDDRLKDHL
jgi:transposase-like protein